mmetsp:Transcript_30406/g.81776  ORF Transcript_30406/g.81776 Transcript_30406/m.81776 type:complete len:151 (+) Transcript_30406:31-483(+)
MERSRGKQPARFVEPVPSPQREDHARDEALAQELQLRSDMEMAAQLQAELDGELAEQLSALEMAEQEAVAVSNRLARHASKAITHLGKGTAKVICTELKIGPSLGDLLRVCSDASKLSQVVSLVDPGQRDRVHAEIVALLAETDLVSALR